VFSIPPRIVDGRFVELDTTEVDRRLISELTPLGDRLAAWVEAACQD
jgi:hypothetical protein